MSEKDYKGKAYNDYKNPILWLITVVALAIPFFVVLVMKIQLGGIIAATLIGIIWILLWEIYKRTSHFKARYGY